MTDMLLDALVRSFEGMITKYFYRNRYFISRSKNKRITDDIKNLYIENGGNPYLDGAYSTSGKGHTVFAQVFEGMDVVNKIAGVQTNQSDKPLEDVKIETIESTKYQ